MGKNKKENQKRKRLRTLVLLLFITIIMFGTSTYAWFTANRMVTINSINVQVEAANGIQISTDGKTWKSVITNQDILSGYTNSVNQLPLDVTAVSTNGEPTSAGRLNMYSAIIDTDAGSGDYTIETQLETDTDGDVGKYVAFDFFLKVDTNQPVYLTPASDVTTYGATDRGLKNASRIAFINLGHTNTTSPLATITALNAGTDATVKLWEPNYDAHEDVIITTVAPDMGVTLTSSGANTYQQVTYFGVNAATADVGEGDPLDLKDVVTGDDDSITDEMTTWLATPAGNDEYNIFEQTLVAGITKYRVYMWVEGQDIDCDNYATGTAISFNVQLSTTNGASSSSAAASSSSGE